MPKFGVKDIVKIKNTHGIHYMVTDFYEEDNTIWYKLIKIFPVGDEFIGEILSEEDLSLVAKYKENELQVDVFLDLDVYERVIQYLDLEYERLTKFDSLEHFIDEALTTIPWDRIKKRRIFEKAGAKNNNIIITDETIAISEEKITLPSLSSEQVKNEINYDKFNDINECLDWMNYLMELYEMTGDDEWLEKRKRVVKRLEQLTKEKKE